MLSTIVIILLVALDQLVKYIVRTQIPLGGSVAFLPGFIGFRYIRNEGAAFSMMTGARWFFVALTLAFVIFALWVLYTHKLRHPLGQWAWVLVIAGAIGNLIDRALFGYVVDMIEVQFMNFAIFNVADCFVVVGGIAFCVYYLFLHDKKDEKLPAEPEQTENAGDTDDDPV